MLILRGIIEYAEKIFYLPQLRM